MRFLFDQSTDRRLAPFLRQRGHDVLVVAVDYPPSLPDDQVLAIAQQEVTSESWSSGTTGYTPGSSSCGSRRSS